MLLGDYTSDDTCIERLLREYYEHDNLVVAVDFDNTIYDFHGTGQCYDATLEILRVAVEQTNIQLFIFTANEDHNLVRRHTKALFGKTFPINESPLDHLFQGRKPFYNLLLDDRAGLRSSLLQLAVAVREIIKRKRK